LARWLASPKNPLAARIFVNRVWNELFGSGIVESIENFGSSGQFPANQALLDSLALRFQAAMGWRLKQLLREIVLSSTYDKIPRSIQELGPPIRNRNPRGPRNRLTAEMIRDHRCSSLVLPENVRPTGYATPAGWLWLSAYNGESWQNAMGEDRFRGRTRFASGRAGIRDC
jgi:hypothetical protein